MIINSYYLYTWLLSHFSRFRLCATPETAAHQAPPSLGISRQEHWSGLPFLSPMNESENWKWKWSRFRPSATPRTAAYQAPPSMGFSRQEYWSGVPLPSLIHMAHYSNSYSLTWDQPTLGVDPVATHQIWLSQLCSLRVFRNPTCSHTNLPTPRHTSSQLLPWST